MSPCFGTFNHVRIGDSNGHVRGVLDDGERNGDYLNISDESVVIAH